LFDHPVDYIDHPGTFPTTQLPHSAFSDHLSVPVDRPPDFSDRPTAEMVMHVFFARRDGWSRKRGGAVGWSEKIDRGQLSGHRSVTTQRPQCIWVVGEVTLRPRAIGWPEKYLGGQESPLGGRKGGGGHKYRCGYAYTSAYEYEPWSVSMLLHLYGGMFFFLMVYAV